MIRLKNGDYWIIDTIEYEYRNISDEAASKKEIPLNSVREFINLLYLNLREKLTDSDKINEKAIKNALIKYLHVYVIPDHQIDLFLPRKWTNEFNGYWDANFDFTEIFNSECINKLEMESQKVYEMEWGEVFVIYIDSDIGGYDICTKILKFSSKKEYNDKFLLK